VHDSLCIREAQIVIETWRRHYSVIRPLASLVYKPSAPEVFVPVFFARPAEVRRLAPPATRDQEIRAEVKYTPPLAALASDLARE